MENAAPKKKYDWERISLIGLLVFGIVILFFLVSSILDGKSPQAQHSTTSDLINTKDIAALSVSEFVYNGIARTYKDNGEPDYNVLYKSTVKASVDADNVDYFVDEEKKIVTFIFPEITIERPSVDENSIKTIPDRSDLYPDDLFSLCRADAYKGASKSEKLISCAQENIKSIMKAWYSPFFEEYTFKYIFGAAEGGEAR